MIAGRKYNRMVKRVESRKKGARHKPKRITIIVTVLIVAIIAFIFGRNFVEIYRLSAEKASIQSQIEAADRKSAELDEELAQIGSRSYIEQIARERLGLYYPDEKIVRTVPGAASNESQDNNSESTGNENATSSENDTEQGEGNANE